MNGEHELVPDHDEEEDDIEECYEDEVRRKENGLPQEWSELKTFGGDTSKLGRNIVIFTIVETLIGIGIAFLVYKFSPEKSKYDSRIATIAATDFGFVYFIPFWYLLCKMIMAANAVKYRGIAGVDAPNQQVYKVFIDKASEQLPYVMMEDEGYVGKFNRAQRAISNLLEYLPEMLALNLLGGYVFPIAMFILVGLFCVIRVVYACQYTEAPAGRGTGFMISQHLLAPTMYGLVFWGGLISFTGPL